MRYAGLLFDCEEHGGSVAGSINLRAAEPMHMAALWSCIYDAMSCNKEISSILNPKAGAKVCLRIELLAAFWLYASTANPMQTVDSKAAQATQQEPMLHVPCTVLLPVALAICHT